MEPISFTAIVAFSIRLYSATRLPERQSPRPSGMLTMRSKKNSAVASETRVRS